MSGPIHFVDITGAMQTLGPGATIQFNGMDGTRQEIVLVGKFDLDNIRQVIQNLELARQQLLERESSLREDLVQAQREGRLAQSEICTLRNELVGVGQHLSDLGVALQRSIDVVERESLSKLNGLRETFGPTMSLSVANSEAIEAIARKLSQIARSLSRPSSFDEENAEYILGLDVRLGEELPNVWETISALRQDVDTNDHWATSKIQSLYDFMGCVEKDALNRLGKLRWWAVSGVFISAIALLLSIISLFV